MFERKRKNPNDCALGLYNYIELKATTEMPLSLILNNSF
jgi:hypothetical protein